MGHPRRLANCTYRGKRRLFITVCAANSLVPFRESTVSELVVAQLLQHAEQQEIEVSAYCLMPDHLHALLRGVSDASDFTLMIRLWKQTTGFWFRRERGRFLWQRGYWDQVLRADDDPLRFVHYALWNPVRDGLVERLKDYPWFGSSSCGRDDLVTTVERYRAECAGPEGPAFIKHKYPYGGDNPYGS